MRIHLLLVATASLIAAAGAPAQPSDTAFLDFPYVDSISAAKVPAFAWLSRQADKSTVFFARAPEFRRTELASRTDDAGPPISGIVLSPDGAHLLYMTGVPRGDQAFNPASLVPAPTAKLWLISTAAGAKPTDLGSASEPSFSPAGRRLRF